MQLLLQKAFQILKQKLFAFTFQIWTFILWFYWTLIWIKNIVKDFALTSYFKNLLLNTKIQINIIENSFLKN